VHEQQREERALLRARDPPYTFLAGDLERPEDAERKTLCRGSKLAPADRGEKVHGAAVGRPLIESTTAAADASAVYRTAATSAAAALLLTWGGEGAAASPP
jgi:hypothetical protein